MDTRLVAWARAVKARHRASQRQIPSLWLFTDSHRLPDPLPSISSLPRGLAGVVFRHDDVPNRAALARAVARLCRMRRLVMVVAGDARLARAVGAGMHLRGGFWPGQVRLHRRLVSSSAHNALELRRAALSGAHIAFLSPAFATKSHPEVVVLGPVRWLRVARTADIPVAALGGIDHITAARLPARFCHGVGAIGALAAG